MTGRRRTTPTTLALTAVDCTQLAPRLTDQGAMKAFELAVLLLVPVLWLLPSAAVAQPAPGAPLPYAPWDGKSSLGKPARPDEDRPRALERAPDFSRRVVELGADVGAALPSCAGRIDENAACGALAPGLFLSLAALWRPGPYF